MRNALLITCLLSGLSIAIANSPGGIPQERQPATQPVTFTNVVQGFKDLKEGRNREYLLGLIRDLSVAAPVAEGALDNQLEAFAQDCIECVHRLSSSDFGDREAQDTVCQQIVVYCLGFADRLSITTEAALVSQLRDRRDDNGAPLTSERWASLRARHIEYFLHCLRRACVGVDTSWNPEEMPWRNPDHSPRIKDDQLRKAAIAVYGQQMRRHKILDGVLDSAKRGVHESYSYGPVTAADLDLLKSYLQVYVSDEKLRSGLFDVAQKAAKLSQPSTAPTATVPFGSPK